MLLSAPLQFSHTFDARLLSPHLPHCKVIVHSAVSAHAGRKGRYLQQDSDRVDQVIAPIDPTSTSAAGPGFATAVSFQPGASSTPRQGTNTRHDGRRGPLVKIRTIPRRRRGRKRLDVPRVLHMRPGEPAFEARLLNEINAVYGPRCLNKIIEDFSDHFSPSHAAAAISLLAGMVTGRQLSAQELGSTYRGPAAKVAAVFEAQVDTASLKDCARVVYGLARLQLHRPQLLAAVERVSLHQLNLAAPQALAGLAVGLAHWGHTPGPGWVAELCSESFAAMEGFSAQDLANLMFSLAVWRTSVSQPFLLRCLTAFRGHWGSAGCSAPALIRFCYALTQLPACQDLPPIFLEVQPEGAPVYLHHEQYRQQRELQVMSGIMGLSPQEAAAAVAPQDGAAATPAAVMQSAAGSGSGDATSSSSSSSSSRLGRSAVSSYRLPSFNWLTSFLAECRRQMDHFRPAELSTLLWCCAALNHTPDLVFMEAWYRASAARLDAFSPPALAAALQALGMLQPGKEVPGAVPGRWLQAVLQHSGQLMQLSAEVGGRKKALDSASRGGGRQGQVVEGVESSTQMHRGQQVVQQQPGQQHGAQQGSVCSAADLSKMLWGLAELKIWPGKPWMEAWLSASAAQLHTARPSDLSDMAWALARLRWSPDDAWMSQLSTAITSHLQGFTPQGLAAVIWAYTRLGARPDRLWLLRFRAVAAACDEGSSGSSGQQLAQFVAAFLAQQNRQRFANGADRLAPTSHAPGRSKQPAVGAPAAGRGMQTRYGRYNS